MAVGVTRVPWNPAVKLATRSDSGLAYNIVTDVDASDDGTVTLTVAHRPDEVIVIVVI